MRQCCRLKRCRPLPHFSETRKWPGFPFLGVSKMAAGADVSIRSNTLHPPGMPYQSTSSHVTSTEARNDCSPASTGTGALGDSESARAASATPRG